VHERGPKRTYRPDLAPPTLHAEHPPGIATPHLAHGHIGAFDEACADWPELAEELMRAGGVTVTLGFGLEHYATGGGAAARGAAAAGPGNARAAGGGAPVGLAPLPAFAGDALDPARCGGAACVLIASEQPTDALRRFGTPRWERRGTRNPTGALGFRDGVNVPRRPLDLDRHVWVGGNDRSAMLGGTYLVVRDIDVDPGWQRLDRAEQERVIGRDKATNAPLTKRRLFDLPDLGALARDAHIRVASPRTTNITILRRGYDTDTGLLFLAFMRDPRRQFVPLQRRLAEQDALHPYTTARGSAVFAVPPGRALPL